MSLDSQDIVILKRFNGKESDTRRYKSSLLCKLTASQSIRAQAESMEHDALNLYDELFLSFFCVRKFRAQNGTWKMSAADLSTFIKISPIFNKQS